MNPFTLLKKYHVQTVTIALFFSLSYPLHIEMANGGQTCVVTPKKESFAALHKPISPTREVLTFLKKAYEKRKSVGAIVPSSDALAKAMIQHIDGDKRGKKIIEVGAGSGKFTKFIIDNKLKSEDTFIVIELDEDFYKILVNKFGHLKNVHIYCLDVLEWPKHKDYDPTGYDYLVSGLPLNSFEPELVKAILILFSSLVKQDTVVSYFEYMFFPTVKRTFTHIIKTEAGLKFLLIEGHKNMFRDQFLYTDSKQVFMNFPSARVVYCTNTQGILPSGYDSDEDEA